MKRASENSSPGKSCSTAAPNPSKLLRMLTGSLHKNMRTLADSVNLAVQQTLRRAAYANGDRSRYPCEHRDLESAASLYELLPPKEAKRVVDRLEFRYTPKHGSWLNIAEIELSHLSRQCLNRRLKDIDEVKKEVSVWLKDRNEEARIVEWRFTVDDARIKLKKLYPTIGKINETL